ncbi:MAG TPA: methyltransferase domain-containing protein, partial [Planctomycetaceae bacterium]|nr:methyltransferase domain-containing protein [Planctomycetaceae bacterium]
RRSAATRSAYMADTTIRLLDIARVAAGTRVLAVGVGTGGEAFDAAVRVGPDGHVVATDISAEMIAAAEEAVAEAGLTNVQFRVMDAQRLDFPKATFDAVISRNTLMFVPDLSLGLAEMKRVLKPSGRVGATVWSNGAHNPRISGPLAAARALGARLPESATYRLALRLSKPGVLSAALHEAGFTEIDVHRVSLIARYATFDEAVTQAMEQPGARELIGLLGLQSTLRMRRALERRWVRYVDRGEVNLPGEQLVAAGTA